MSPTRLLAEVSGSPGYWEQGYLVLENVIPSDCIDDLLNKYVGLIYEMTGRLFTGPNDPALIEFFNQRRDIESQVYVAIRRKPWLHEFARQEAILTHVKQLLGEKVGLFRKIPFRIDMPDWLEELAHWHQDYFYVKGNTDVITAWIPLQETTFVNGCLSIMPRSHRLGPLEHGLRIGKKWVPDGIFGNEIRMVEMKKGDLLLFNALLLHSGNLNLSSTIRYSIQARYTSLGLPVDEEMGGIIPL